MARITLIFDPFSIYQDAGVRVAGLDSEKRAFREIDDLLRRDKRLETVVPKTYVISAESAQHFQSYHGVTNVRIEKITPRSSLAEKLHLTPPDWLDDDLIYQWQLLNYPSPGGVFEEGWDATIAAWLIPGIEGAGTLKEWFSIVATILDRFLGVYGKDPASIWIQQRFTQFAEAEIASREVVSDLSAELIRAASPRAFAQECLRRKARLPLVRASMDNPFKVVGLETGTPRERAISSYLPLPYPLPEPLHSEISAVFAEALRRVRIAEEHRLADAIQSLNAIWDGVAEEIQSWLAIYPRGLSRSAATHLSQLPGFQASESLATLVSLYAPPDSVASWEGFTGDLEQWMTGYARYARTCFLRRELDEANDPAVEFGRWLKDHHTVSFEHHIYSYSQVAQAVQKGLRSKRTVLLIMVDALPIHLSSYLTSCVSDQLGEEASRSSFVFVPIPTVTYVCKEAVLTGKRPRDCNGDLFSQLKQRYSLGTEEILLTADWQDAERLQIEASTRLIVYRDNRIDELLHRTASYRTMLEDSKVVFERIASLIDRWVKDIRSLEQVAPLILVTADHGFTYGPKPGSETRGHRALDGTHRCVKLDGDADPADLEDDSITVIMKEIFHLRSSYLAARGRYFGTGTMSGWSMSHGGLLPEEVVVPVLEWFGSEKTTPWPTVSFQEKAVLELGELRLTFRLSNEHSMVSQKGTLTITLAGEGTSMSMILPSLLAGDSQEQSLSIPMNTPLMLRTITIDVQMEGHRGQTDEPVKHVQTVEVPVARSLVEKTKEQSAFEDMF